MKTSIFAILAIFLGLVAKAQVQPPTWPSYLTIEEITKNFKTINISKTTAVVDQRSVIHLKIEGSKLPDNLLNIKPQLLIKRDGAFINIPENTLATQEAKNLIPTVDPNTSIPRTARNVGRDEVFDVKVDLKILSSILKNSDILTILITEPGRSTLSVELEINDLGLDAPKELSVPLTIIKYKGEDAKLGYGISGILHVNTRKKLENVLGFGLTLSPTSVDLANLSNSTLSIMPTISIGFGKKILSDVFLLGYGPTIGGSKKGAGFFSINLSFISRVITNSANKD